MNKEVMKKWVRLKDVKKIVKVDVYERDAQKLLQSEKWDRKRKGYEWDRKIKKRKEVKFKRNYGNIAVYE